MSETQNAQCTCSLRKEHYHITEVIQKNLLCSPYLFSFRNVYVKQYSMSQAVLYNVTLLPKVTMVQPQDPICKFFNVTCICLPLAFFYTQPRIFSKIFSFLASLSGLYKCCSFFKI